MSDETKEQTPKAPIDFSHPSIGGKKLDLPAPVKGEKEIRFENLGARLVMRSPLWADSDNPTAKPAEPVEKEDNARE
jgi:hypothetical protein